MRILICYPWLELGGAPKTAITLAKGLKERGHEVYFFSKEGGMYESLLEKAEIPLISAPYHFFLPQMFHLNYRAYRLLKQTVEKNKIDIIHAFHANSYFLSLFLAPRKNIPVIFSAVWFQYARPYPFYPGRFIFVAEEFLDHSKPYMGKHAKEMIVIPNRVDLDRFNKDVDCSGFVREKGLPEEGLRIAFMSRLGHTKEKSVFYSMDAAGILMEKGFKTTLVIAGEGPSYERLFEHAKKINNKYSRNLIIFIGKTSKTPELMSWADIVLGIGRSAFEGMATSKPTCIVGERGLAGVVKRETVEELQYYNFAGRNIKTQQDPSLLADTIEEIMTDKKKYKELAAFSRKYVIENYGYRAGAEKLEKIYEEALRDINLSRYEKIRSYVTNLLHGYIRSFFKALKSKLGELLKN